MEEGSHGFVGRTHLLLESHYLLALALHALELPFLDFRVLQIEIHLHGLHVVVFGLFEHFVPLFVLQDFLGVPREEVFNTQLSSQQFLRNSLVPLVIEDQPLLSAKLDVGLLELQAFVVHFVLQFLHEDVDDFRTSNIAQDTELLQQLVVELLPHFVGVRGLSLVLIRLFAGVLWFLNRILLLGFSPLRLFPFEDLLPVFPDLFGELLDVLGKGFFFIFGNFPDFNVNLVFVEEFDGDGDLLEFVEVLDSVLWGELLSLESLLTLGKDLVLIAGHYLIICVKETSLASEFKSSPDFMT